MNKDEISGIILCGGKSKRMGKNKALLKLGQKTTIEHVIETLNKICGRIILSTNGPDLDFLPQAKVPDKYNNMGPIAGFYSTLLETKTEHNIIVSCDTPFISDSLLTYLLEQSKSYDLVLPVFKNQLQPMTGYFRKSFVQTIEKELAAENKKPINIFENSNLNSVEITSELDFYHEHLFFNINNPEDYEQAKIIYKSIS